jgi:hypothetical protein
MNQNYPDAISRTHPLHSLAWVNSSIRAAGQLGRHGIGAFGRSVRVGHRCRPILAAALLCLGLFGMPQRSAAQWTAQTFQLQAGWNAIYLAVQPSPASCDALFANLPVEGVYRHNARRTLAQFDTNPDDLFFRPDEWLQWVPDDGQSGFVRTLNNLPGDATYLIKARTNFVWTVVGRPVLPRLEWVEGKANMVGFQVNPDPAQQPVFADFFRYEPGVDATPNPGEERIYEIGPQLQHTNITGRTSRQKILPGRAYWIYAQGLSDFVGGLEVYAGASEGLVYGTEYNELILRVRNRYGSPVTVSVQHMPSAAPPADTPRQAGETPLLWADRTDGGWVWQPWAAGTKSATRQLATNELWEIRLALNRSAMTEPTLTNALWQSLVQVSSTCGSFHQVPVSAAFARGTDQAAAFPYGLWVGQADITHVSFSGFSTNAAGESPTEPLRVSSPFPLRLILHASQDGTMRLVDRALVATLQESGNLAVNRLFTDETRVPAGANVSMRLSSPAFGRITPVTLSGTGFLRSLQGVYAVGYDDPTNPFKHLYHPDHDNKHPVTGAKLAEGIEGFSITNQVVLTWSTNSMRGPFTALWNPDETTTGTYEQVISNLRHVPIRLRGEFVLKRVSRVARID